MTPRRASTKGVCTLSGQSHIAIIVIKMITGRKNLVTAATKKQPAKVHERLIVNFPQ